MVMNIEAIVPPADGPAGAPAASEQSWRAALHRQPSREWKLEAPFGETILARTGRGVRLGERCTDAAPLARCPRLFDACDLLLGADDASAPWEPMSNPASPCSRPPTCLPEQFRKVVVEIRGKDRALGLIRGRLRSCCPRRRALGFDLPVEEAPVQRLCRGRSASDGRQDPVTERACLNPRRRNRGPSSRALGALEAEALPRPLTRGREARHLHRGAADCARRSSLCGDASPRRR